MSIEVQSIKELTWKNPWRQVAFPVDQFWWNNFYSDETNAAFKAQPPKGTASSLPMTNHILALNIFPTKAQNVHVFHTFHKRLD